MGRRHTRRIVSGRRHFINDNFDHIGIGWQKVNNLLVLYHTLKYEPVREKTNNMGSDQVRHKPNCTVTEKS